MGAFDFRKGQFPISFWQQNTARVVLVSGRFGEGSEP
jgi:hypothetical protein